MLISEDVITAMARFPPDLRLIIIQYAPEPEWDNYVTGRYNETKKEDSRLLGGGKPVVGGATRSVTQWKVDENELGTDSAATSAAGGPSSDSSSSAGGSVGIKGEFKRTTSVGRPVSTADFGPADPIVDDGDDDEDDEDNVSSGRAPHVCLIEFFLEYFRKWWVDADVPRCFL